VGSDTVRSYVGLRADEQREGYISHKPNIVAVYPFRDEGITKGDVFRLLETSGLGLPAYYAWRSRSGCYFCFFQQKIEWVGLMESHPDLFNRARQYERWSTSEKQPYTWCQGESLDELSRPERVAQIKAEHARRVAVEQERRPNRPLVDVLDGMLVDWDYERPCLICDL
jgi:hypothetical protein